MLFSKMFKKAEQPKHRDIYDRLIEMIPTIDNKLLERWYYVSDAERVARNAVIKELKFLDLVELEMGKRGLL